MLDPFCIPVPAGGKCYYGDLLTLIGGELKEVNYSQCKDSMKVYRVPVLQVSDNHK